MARKIRASPLGLARGAVTDLSLGGGMLHPKSQILSFTVPLARSMRRDPTRSEALLWRALRGRGLGVRFRRQHPIERYILDFYAPSIRLAIEVDGSIHERRRDSDAERDAVLGHYGITVLRLEAALVEHALGGALEHVLAAVRRA